MKKGELFQDWQAPSEFFGKAEPLMKPVPKGVDPGKYDRCVDDVKGKGGSKNAYAVCATALKAEDKSKKIGKQEAGGPPMDQVAYKQCVEQEKSKNSSNPYTICRWRVGHQGAQKNEADANDTEKVEREITWVPEHKEAIDLLSMVSRKPKEIAEQAAGQAKENAIFEKGTHPSNAKKTVRSVPQMKPPLRAQMAAVGPKMPASAKAAPAPAPKPAMRFKETLQQKSVRKSEVEMTPGMSYSELQKSEDLAKAKAKTIHDSPHTEIDGKHYHVQVIQQRKGKYIAHAANSGGELHTMHYTQREKGFSISHDTPYASAHASHPHPTAIRDHVTAIIRGHAGAAS